MRDIPEADGKVLRQAHKAAVEHFCGRVLAEAARLARDDPRSPHERYLALYKLICCPTAATPA